MRNHRNKWLVRSLLLMLAFFTVGAYADCGGSGYCGNVRITLLYIGVTGDAWISVSGNINALPCTLNGNLIQLSTAAANFKTVYATLLAAQAADRTINVRVDPGSTQCSIAWMEIPSP